MDREETAAIMSILQAAYPRFYKDQKENEMLAALNLWSMMFKDDPTKIVTEAVKALLTTLKYPPTIADVKEKILLLTRPLDMAEAEAWGKVYKAIQSASYYAQENFDNLPPILRRLVGSPNQLREWAQMDSDTVKSVISSNFNRSYTARVRQEKEFQMLPQTNKEIIKALSDNFNMLKLDGDKE